MSKTNVNKPIVDVIIVKHFDNTTQTLKTRRIPSNDIEELNNILNGSYGQFTRLTAINEQGSRYFITAVKIHEIVNSAQSKSKSTAKGGDR